MHLMQLSVELLLQILEYLGASFFRDDIQRLTVCKRWHAVALTIFWEDLTLSSISLERMLFAPGAKRRLALLTSSLRRVDIEIGGFVDGDTLPGSGSLSLSLWSINNTECEHQTELLDPYLSEFVAILEACRNLQKLRFTVSNKSEKLIVRDFGPRDYLYNKTLDRLFSLKHLITLELDMCCSPRRSKDQARWHTSHLPHTCPHIAKLLPQLRRLHLRMRYICTDALCVPENCDTIPLNELVINLSFARESATVIPLYSLPCGRASQDRETRLPGNIEEGARELSKRMMRPKLVQVQTFSVPSRKEELFDVLTGKRTILAEDYSGLVESMIV